MQQAAGSRQQAAGVELLLLHNQSTASALWHTCTLGPKRQAAAHTVALCTPTCMKVDLPGCKARSISERAHAAWV